jgi:hypothetical protein
MSYDSAGLVSMSHGTGKNMVWFYKSDDLISTISGSGYFNSATGLLTKGDQIVVSGDQDGTPATTQLSVNSATAAATVTTVDLATATLTFQERVVVTASLTALGTSETIYVVSPVAGSVSYVSGVTNVNGAGSGGTSTITLSVPTTGAIATLPFLQDVVAGTTINDSTITAHTALAAGGVMTLATDGTGSHTGRAFVTIQITPA